MKFIDKPTIELEEKDIEAVKVIREMIIDMPCSSLECSKCPLNTICDFVITETGGANKTVLAMQKALNDALIK